MSFSTPRNSQQTVIVMVSKEEFIKKRKFHNSQEKDSCARLRRYWLHSGIVKFHLKFSIYALARRTDRWVCGNRARTWPKLKKKIVKMYYFDKSFCLTWRRSFYYKRNILGGFCILQLYLDYLNIMQIFVNFESNVKGRILIWLLIKGRGMCIYLSWI